MLHGIETTSSKKWLSMHPATKLLAAGFPFAVCLAAGSLLADLVTFLVMVAVALWAAAVPGRIYLRMAQVPLGFVLLGAIAIILQVNPQPGALLAAFQLGSFRVGVTGPSLLAGLHVLLRSVACMSCLFLIVLTTPMPDLLDQLRRWHVPALLVSLMVLIYRFVFVLLEESHRMQTAQACRLGQRNFRTALQSSGTLAGQLFFRAYLRTDRVHAAMLSRGYTGAIPVLEHSYEQRHCLLAASLIGSAALVALALLERTWL